jgi:outer membrane immunogenic protein
MASNSTPGPAARSSAAAKRASNWQAGWFVAGLEADFDWASNNNNSNNSAGIVFPSPIHDTFLVTSNNRWIASVAARIGWVVYNHWLFYGKGGGGWVGNNGFAVTDLTTGTSISTGSNTRSGWLAGAGVEWALAPNWTLKFEYDYLGLNSRTFIIPLGAPFPAAFIGDVFTGRRNVQEVKVGFNYLFNWWWSAPIAAPY